MSNIEPISGQWQPIAIQQFTDLLKDRDEVLSVAIIGSGAQSPKHMDTFSDVDVLIILDNSALDNYFPELDWLSTLGDIFAYERHTGEFIKTIRICYTDFRRFDLVLTTISALEQDKVRQSLIARQRRTLFNHDPNIDLYLDKTKVNYEPSPMSSVDFEVFVNQFWFKQVIALQKIARNDLLVALHLALDAIRDCLVIGMLLRDQKDETWNHIINNLKQINQTYTLSGILQTLSHTGQTFDDFARYYSDNYKPRSSIYKRWIDSVDRHSTPTE